MRPITRLLLLGLLLPAGCAAFTFQDPARAILPVHRIIAPGAGSGRSAALRHDPSEPVRAIDGPLTLQQCVALAMHNNKSLQELKEEIWKARGDKIAAISRGFPQVGLSMNYVRLDEEVTAELGGMSVTLAPTDSYKAEIGITQPLFTGGQLTYGVEMARIGEAMARLGIDTAQQQIAFAACATFFNVLYTQENLNISRENLQLAKAHHENVSKRLAQGVASPFEELRARTRVANQEALELKARNQVRQARLELLRVIGLPMEDAVEIEGKLMYLPYDADFSAAFQIALIQRPDLALANARIELRKTNLKLTRAELFPKIAAFFNLGWEKPSGKSFIAGAGSDYWNGGLAISFPLFDGFATHGKLMKGHASVRQALWKRADLVDEISLTIRKAIIGISDAQEFVKAAQKNLALAQEGKRLAQVGYNNGVNSQLDLLDAENGLAQAKYGYVQAVFGHVMARANLQQAMGMVLETVLPDFDEQDAEER